jgi:hypothetical protein
MRELFPALARRVPDPDARMRDVTEFDPRFGRHPDVTRLHTTRVIGAILDPALTPYGDSAPQVLGLSLWVGWLLTIAVAEVRIRRSHYSVEARIA